MRPLEVRTPGSLVRSPRRFVCFQLLHLSVDYLPTILRVRFYLPNQLALITCSEYADGTSLIGHHPNYMFARSDALSHFLDCDLGKQQLSSCSNDADDLALTPTAALGSGRMYAVLHRQRFMDEFVLQSRRERLANHRCSLVRVQIRRSFGL